MFDNKINFRSLKVDVMLQVSIEVKALRFLLHKKGLRNPVMLHIFPEFR